MEPRLASYFRPPVWDQTVSDELLAVIMGIESFPLAIGEMLERDRGRQAR
jgi:hypothetical protein